MMRTARSPERLLCASLDYMYAVDHRKYRNYISKQFASRFAF
jgi:hypothetical protein